MPLPDGAYTVAMDGEKPVGGIFGVNADNCDEIPEGWFAYLEVDDVEVRLDKAVAAGAEIVRPAFDVPGAGRIAILKQPDGAKVGWMTPANR